MSNLLKNLNKKYFIALGIGIAIIFLIIDFVPFTYNIFTQLSIIHLAAVIVALFFLIIVLIKIVSKTFTTKVYNTIIMLLIGAIIAISIGLIFTSFKKDILLTIAIIVCVVVLGLTLTVKIIEERLETGLPMSSEKKNLNQKYYIALGIGIALIFLIIGFIPYMKIYPTFYPSIIIRLSGTIVALFLLIIALIIIVRKTFTTNVYKSINNIIMLLIGAIIATSISLIFDLDFLKIIVIVVCVVVLAYTLKVKKGEEGEISSQHKIAQREYNKKILTFAVGGGLIVIGIFAAIIGLTGLGGLGVTKLNNFSGYLLLGLLLGPSIIFFIVPGYFIVRFGYRKYYLSKQ